MASPVYQISCKLPCGSEVISGGDTDRHSGDLISLLSFLESRLKSK
jgi:hypothetical protein